VIERKDLVPAARAYDGAVGSRWEECMWRPTALGVWAAEAAVEVLMVMEHGPRLRWDWWGGR
jgi:hypothetical protein